MIKRDPKKEHKFEKGSLSSFSDYGLTIPFAKMNSTMRQHMWHSHIRQTIVPVQPERPLVDTRYTKDILFSSDNLLSKGKVTLKATIEKKVITDFICHTTHIYYDHADGLHYVEKIPRYKGYSKYSYEMKSEFDNMKPGETKNKVYTKYISSMDTRDGGIAFGRNVSYIYSIDERVGEDSYVISQRLADAFAVNTMYTPDIVFDPNTEMLYDLYGFLDENGIMNYKPFPLPGEEIKDGVVTVISKMNKDFLSISTNEIHNSDISYFVHSGIVTDIEVYSNEVIDNQFLEKIRRDNMDYNQQIIHAISEIPIEKQSVQMKHYFERLVSIQGKKLRFGLQELKDKCRIRLTIVGQLPLQVGSKITNRHGGKGTISEIIPNPMIAEDGGEIDMKVNATGVVNRENVAQQIEQGLNVLNTSLMKYLKQSDDNINKKFNNLVKWCTLAKLGNARIESLHKYSKEDIIKHYSENDMYMKYDPFDEALDWDNWFLGLTEFTLTLDPTLGEKTIYENGVPLGAKHVYGKAFYVVLENGPFKDTSIRSDKINTSKGALTKVGLDKKKYHSKYLTTAVKQSDLSLNISISSQFDEDKDLLSADLDQLDRRLNAMGIEIGLKTIKGDKS